jgi:hypothetical protein
MTPSLSVFKYSKFKGFFTKKLTGEYYLCFLVLDDGYLLFQFVSEYKENTYIIGMIGAGSTKDDDYIEEMLAMMDTDSSLELIEKRVPVKIGGSQSINIKFLKPSKVFLSTIDIYKDSRFEHGIYLADVKMKKEYKPVALYKVAGDFKFITGMTNVTKAFFIKNILKSDKIESNSAMKKLI